MALPLGARLMKSNDVFGGHSGGRAAGGRGPGLLLTALRAQGVPTENGLHRE